jgi:DNA primase
VAGWQVALASRPKLVGRLVSQRGWGHEAMRELELGFDRGRITIPIRSRHGRLRGVLRYRPDGRPKMLAVHGTRLGLIPHPAVEPSEHVLLVEGPPDMIAARSRGLPAIAVPGDHSWRPEWAALLTGRRVTVVSDADAPGRALATRIARNLYSVVSELVAVDLAPEREDGYDLTDWLLEHPAALTVERLPRLV